MSIEIKITLHDEKQAHALKNALDLYCRLCVGQFGEIADLMRSEVIPAMTDHTGPRVPLAIESIERVDALLDHMKYAIGYNGMNMSIGNPHIHDTAHRNWELLKVLRRELAIHRNPAPIARGTDYDGLTLRYTQDEAPEVQIHRFARVTLPRYADPTISRSPPMSKRQLTGSAARRAVLASPKFTKSGAHIPSRKCDRSGAKLKLKRGQWHDQSSLRTAAVMPLAFGGHQHVQFLSRAIAHAQGGALPA